LKIRPTFSKAKRQSGFPSGFGAGDCQLASRFRFAGVRVRFAGWDGFPISSLSKNFSRNRKSRRAFPIQFSNPDFPKVSVGAADKNKTTPNQTKPCKPKQNQPPD